MATITTLAIGGISHPSYSAQTKMPYLAEIELNWAEVVTAKGSAIAASDVIEAIKVPAYTAILGVGAQVITVGNATAATVDIGVTGVDADEWVDGYDIIAATGMYTPLAVTPDWTITGATADTVDVLIASLTDTLSTGKLRVFALLLDIAPKKAPGIAAVGS